MFFSKLALAVLAATASLTTALPAPQQAANVPAAAAGQAAPAAAGAAAGQAAPAAAGAAGAAAANSPLATANVDQNVLQFALTLEHLEATFYQVGLTKFNAAAFAKAGFKPFVRQEFQIIANHEAIHVTTLMTAINAAFGANVAVPACTYNFNTALANVQNFVTFASILERTGVQAYVGANHLLTNANFKTAAAAIATVEGRHSAFLNLLTNVNPAPGPFETPLGAQAIISIAAGLIQQCPYALPVAPFPPLTVTNMANKATVTIGQNAVVAFKLPAAAAGAAAPALMCNWVAGLTQTRTAIVQVAMPAAGSSSSGGAAAPAAGTNSTMMARRQATAAAPAQAPAQAPAAAGAAAGAAAAATVPACMVPAAINGFTQAVLFIVNANADVALDNPTNVVAGPATVKVKPMA